MTARTLFLVALLTAVPCAADAQNTPPKTQPTPDTAAVNAAVEFAERAADRARAQAKLGQAVNIRVDVVITDQRGPDPPSKRTLSVVAADMMSGRVRTTSNVAGIGDVPLNVDASPEILPSGKIRLGFGLQYGGPGANDAIQGNPPRGTVMSTSINQQISLIAENGKPMVVAQSADPIGDRKVTVEVTATILK